VQGIDQLLGSSHGKGGNQERPAPLVGLIDNPLQFLFRLRVGRMLTVAVGALHDEDIRALAQHGRIIDDGNPAPPNIAAEDQPEVAILLLIMDVENHVGTAHHMAGIHQGEMHAGQDLPLAVITDADELIHGRDHIVLGVEGFKFLLPVLSAELIDEGHVLFLDVRGIHKHHRAEVAGGRGADNISPEPFLDQAGDAAGMIDVGVGQDQAIEILSRAKAVAVEFEGLLALALKQPAIKKNPLAVHLKQML